MPFRIYNGRLPKAGYFGMCHALKKSPFRRVVENFGRDPSTIRPTLRPQADVAPAGPQLADGVGGLQHLSRQLIGVDDVEAELRKAGSRRGLAAADTASESDDHTPPYLPGRPRANLKRGWARTVGRGQRRRLG